MSLRARLSRLLRNIEVQTGGYCSPAVTLLLAANTLVFLAIMVSGNLPRASSPLLAYLWADESIWSGQVWRLVTATFTHELVFHWFFNMLGLFFFGNHLERHFGFRGFWLMVFVVAVVSNLVHVIFFPSPVIGFSGIIYAIIVGFAAIAPTARVLMLVIPMPAWVLAAVFVGLDLLNFIQLGGSSHRAYDVHLVGAACGLLAVRGGFFIRPFSQRWRQMRHQRAENRASFDQGELDRLLSKVSAQGLPALTKAERNFLQRYSKSRRTT